MDDVGDVWLIGIVRESLQVFLRRVAKTGVFDGCCDDGKERE